MRVSLCLRKTGYASHVYNAQISSYQFYLLSCIEIKAATVIKATGIRQERQYIRVYSILARSSNLSLIYSFTPFLLRNLSLSLSLSLSISLILEFVVSKKSISIYKGTLSYPPLQQPSTIVWVFLCLSLLSQRQPATLDREH